MEKTMQKRFAVLTSAVVALIAIVASVFMLTSPIKASASGEVIDGFEVDSAQVKQYTTDDGASGALRFVLNVSSSIYDAYSTTEWTYGTILIPEHMLGDAELTLGTANVLNLETSKWQTSETDEDGNVINYVYTSVVNFEDKLDSYINTPIVARGYIKNGDTVKYTKAVTRSIGYVAAMNVETGSKNEVLKDIASKTDTRFSFTVDSDRVFSGYKLVFDGQKDASGNYVNATMKTAIDFFDAKIQAIAGLKIGYHSNYLGTGTPATWSEDAKYIVFGDKDGLAEAAGIEVPSGLIGNDGYYITTKGNSIFIQVNDDDAYQLAMLKLLDIFVDYEMYAVDCETYNYNGTINVPDMQIIVRPDVDYRDRGNYQSVGNGRFGMGYTASDIFMPVNGNVYHTALKLLDPEVYYKKGTLGIGAAESNAWFRYWDADSSVLGSYPLYQLCYTTILANESKKTPSDGSLQPMEIIYDNLKATILANPTLENISFGPEDNSYTCDCSGCKSAGAVNSYVKVANALAERLEADPDLEGRTVNLVLFAYRGYETAPTENGLTIHKNVGVMIAPIEANWSTPLSKQTAYAENIAAWNNLTDNMYFWFYQTNFDYYFYPLNSWDVMQDNIKFAYAHDAKYLFYQGAGDANTSHFSKLKDYLESKLMIDSSLNVDTLTDNFFNAYYGAGADDMKLYYDALKEYMASNSTGGYKEEIATQKKWTKEKLQEFIGYINNASAKVESGSSYAQHIKLESLFPRYALYSLYNGSANDKATFMTDCDSLGIKNFCEGKTLESELSGWRHSHTYNVQNPVAENLATEATCTSSATYYYTCSCGLKGTETFASGSTSDHVYNTFNAGTGEDEGYDISTCTGNCGTTVRIKTDYTASAPVDLVNGTSATLTMPDGFVGTVTGGSFGSALTFTGSTFDTTSIQPASHGLWASIDVTFTSEYGSTHTAKVPVTLITKVITTKADFESFATEASNAWAGGTVMYGYYILGADIDCNGTSVSAADAWNNGQFYGTLDGRGHTISNLTAAAYKTGIFGRFHGTMKNICFTDVNMSANSALFGKITDGSTFENVTIGIANWATPTDNTYTGIFGLSQNQNLVLTNVVINIADGITVPQLIGRLFTGATGDVTINLGVDATVINYYSTANNGNSGVTTLPSDSIFTVNQKIAQVIDSETIIEGNKMPVTGLSNGTVSILLGGNTYSGTVESGVLTIDGITTATGKQKENVVITQNDNKYTYTNIWHVTQIIDSADELLALGQSCKDSVVTGYYILGGNIDCSAVATMSNGSGSGTTNGFQGTFDGRNHKISNITMNGYGGLFGKLLGATIKDTTFDNVNLGTNGSLLASGADKNASANTNTTLTNITINLTGYSTGYGVVVGYSMFNTVGSGIVINVADGLTVAALLCRDTCNTLAGGYITATVNLGAGSTITTYCSGTTTKPSTFTVNTTEVYIPVEETVDTLVAAEGTASLTISNALLTKGNALVSINGGEASTVAVTTAGQITIDLGVSAMGKLESLVITTPKGDTLTYTEVWYVTQVIDTVAELKALGAACKAANTTGYYILSGNIDCSAEANMATGNPGWQANGFSGTFDGRGYTISNIKMIYDDATGGYGGLFGNLAGCTIQNVVFDKVNIASTNVALLGRHSYASGGNNVNLTNLTVNVSGWKAEGTSEAGLLLSKNMQNTITTNVIVNIADGLTVNTLLGAECSSIAYVTMTVNLGKGSTITNYYGTTTAKPDTITVNSASAPVVDTLDTLVAGEGTTSVTFTHDAINAGNVTVVINGVTKTLSANAGSLSVDLADFGVSAMGQYSAIITSGSNELTYTDVWYVTQVIDTVAELKALGAACKAANTTGYYILGGNIDCSAEANMAAGNPGWEANGFSGTFDGRGLTISNIKMTWDNATGGYGGLFGNLDGCTIRNIVFDKVNYASVNVSLLGRHTYKNKGPDNTNLENLTVNISNWAATGEAGVFVSRSSRNTLFNNCTVNVADGVTVHNLLGQQFSSLYGSGINVNLGTGSAVTAYYWTGTDVSTAVTTAPSLIKVK